MSHPNTRAERRQRRKHYITRRLKNGGSWTSCHCGDTYWWHRLSAVGSTHFWESIDRVRLDWAKSGLCWNCFAHTNDPRWSGRLSKWHISPEPNRERDWDCRGVLRKDYRAGGGRRSSSFADMINMHAAGPFDLSRTLYEEWERDQWFTADEDLDYLDGWWPEMTLPLVRPEDQVRARRKQRYLRRIAKRQRTRDRRSRWNEVLQQEGPLSWAEMLRLVRQRE